MLAGSEGIKPLGYRGRPVKLGNAELLYQGQAGRAGAAGFDLTSAVRQWLSASRQSKCAAKQHRQLQK